MLGMVCGSFRLPLPFSALRISSIGLWALSFLGLCWWPIKVCNSQVCSILSWLYTCVWEFFLYVNDLWIIFGGISFSRALPTRMLESLILIRSFDNSLFSWTQTFQPFQCPPLLQPTALLVPGSERLTQMCKTHFFQLAIAAIFCYNAQFSLIFSANN